MNFLSPLGAARRCFALLMLVASGASLSAANGATPGPAASVVTELEPFEVIGSRILRTEVEGVAPVATITREDIELTGFQTLGDVVRNLPFNNGTSADPQFGTGFGSGATSLNLRGLGVNSSLVLVNGRRAAPYGLPGVNGFTTLFDFNSIPLAAIDRIEILKDGASALYGSDAVGGVVNIKLRANYNGVSVSTLYGNTTDTDSGLANISATWGMTKGKTSLLLTADWQGRHALFLRDRDFAATADGRIFGGTDGRSTSGYPGYVNVPTKDAANRTPPAGTITGAIISPQGVLLANPTVADFARGASMYNFNDDTSLLPSYEYSGAYARVKQELTPQLHAFGEFSWRRNRSEFVQAASTVVSTSELGTAPTGFMRLPFNNPYNPFGVDIDNFRFRLVPVGPRIRDLVSTTERFLVGLGGSLGWRDWTWESSALYAENRITVDDANSSTDVAVQAALNQTSLATALNPFGPSAPGVAQNLAVTLHRRALVAVRLGDFQATGHLGHLPGGDIGIAVGGERRRENIRDRPDPLTANNGVVSLGGTSGVAGARHVTAAYVEFSLPLWRDFELQLAGRHEDYSDFGKANKPKYAVKYRPTKWLLLRAGFSRSFRAPDLSQLFTVQTVSFSTSFVLDPLRPKDPAALVRVITGGNPNLLPEFSDSYYGGLVVDVPVVKGLEASVDFWRFREKNLIGQFSLANILDLETTKPTGQVTRNPATGDGLPGTISSVSTTFFNVSSAMTDGADFAVRYRRSTPIGNIGMSAALTYTHSYLFNFVEIAKTNGFPILHGEATVHWDRGSWGASVHGTYLDGYAEPSSSVFGPGRATAHRINHNYAINPQLTYRGWRGTKITVGANNVFDRDPPHALSKPELYDNLQVSGEGRFVYVRVSREF